MSAASPGPPWARGYKRRPPATRRAPGAIVPPVRPDRVPLEIPAAALHTALRQALAIGPDASLTAAALATVTTLDLSGAIPAGVDIMFAWGTDADSPRYDEVEFITKEAGAWAFVVIDFATSPPTVKRDEMCQSCHVGDPPHPLWAQYPG